MQQNQVYRPRKNFQIKANQVRVIDEDGNNLGILPLQEAIKKAKESGLDLVELNSKSSPVVAKIADYGKMLYEEKKRLVEIKKNQKTNELKELSFRPNTDENDLNHKLQQTKEFLTEGAKVKLIVKFKGREITHPELGRQKLEWFIKELYTLIMLNPQILFEGKVMYTILSPKSTK